MSNHKKSYIMIVALLLALLAILLRSHPRQLSAAVQQQAAPMEISKPVTEVDIEIMAPPQAADVQQQTEQGPRSKGEFPPIWSSYKEQLGFNRYAQEMETRGAVFFTFQQSSGKWYTLNCALKVLSPFDIGLIGNSYGSKPNSIEDEPALMEVISTLETEGVYLAKPMAMEKHIQDSIHKALEVSGTEIDSVIGFKGTYVLRSGQFSLSIESAATRDRGTIEFDVVIPL